MAVDRGRQLRVAMLDEPARAGVAMAQRPQRIVGGQRLVQVVQQGRRLHDRPVDRVARADRVDGQERRHVGDGRGVSSQRGRG